VDSVQSTPAIRVPSLLKEWLQPDLAESNEWRYCFRLAKVLPALEFPQFAQALWHSRLPFAERQAIRSRRLQPEHGDVQRAARAGDLCRRGPENRVTSCAHGVLLDGLEQT
jgi:hypothetical protein